MEAKKLISEMQNIHIRHFLGVPDSTLKCFCECLNNQRTGKLIHYVPANEGAAVAMAAGIYLATRDISCVYLQNSGIGNLYNPAVSLIHQEVYDIPMLFVIGWRGEPGIKDEPQHIYQGKITLETLKLLGIHAQVLSKETDDATLRAIMNDINKRLSDGERSALVVKKDTFSDSDGLAAQNLWQLVREEAIAAIIAQTKPDDRIVSTTGKISREVYEVSERVLGNHSQSFLTVGSMGHASMIALGIALERKDRRVYCLDGDGAAFMHMGAMPFIAGQKPSNYIHILFNNDAHESVGGMPTGIAGTDYSKIAGACGYVHSFLVTDMDALKQVLQEIKTLNGPVFLEIKTALGSRANLGRPKEQPQDNKRQFMDHI